MQDTSNTFMRNASDYVGACRAKCPYDVVKKVYYFGM
jgi:hypothetical protein